MQCTFEGPADSELFLGIDLNAKNKDDLAVIYGHGGTVSEEIQPAGGRTVLVRRLASWKDPATLPHSRMECVKWCSVTPWDKWCCGHKYQLQWMYVDLMARVTVATPQDVAAALEDCMREAAVVAALSAVLMAITAGPAAVEVARATFAPVLLACLGRKLKEIVGVDVYLSTHWGEWE